MSRISSRASMLASDDRSSSNHQAQGLDLEALLATVMEEREYIPERKRNRRKLRPRRPTLTTSDETQLHSESANEAFSVFSSTMDRVKTADSALVLTIHQHRTGRKPQVILISFRPHSPSEHVLHLQGMVQPMVPVVREPVSATMHAWVAPYEPPPSLERLTAEAADLYIDYVDPQHYFAQFTAADPWVAVQEVHGWWSRVRAPFIRWEVRRAVTSLAVCVEADEVQASETTQPVEATQLFDEQLTALTSLDSPSSSFTFRQRFRRAMRGLFDRLEEGVEGEKDRKHNEVTQEDAWDVPLLVPRLDTVKILAGFMVLLFIASLPAGAVTLARSLRANVDQSVEQSQAALLAARGAFQHGHVSRESLMEATQHFQSAESSLRRANALVLGLAGAMPKARGAYRSSQSILRAGERSTRAVQILSDGMQRAWTTPVHYPNERLQALSLYLDEATPLILEARKQVETVDLASLPETVRPAVVEAKTALIQGEASLKDLRALLDLGLLVLGHNEPRSYLFVFQNPAELRPSGGFMGSVSEVVFDRGVMKKMRTPGGGPYDLRNQLTARVSPPRPLQLLKDQWEFQDANWFPDFALSAQKIRWFWSKSGQPTLDGVIAVNASLLEQLLRLTGPIDLPEFGKTLSAENVLFELQKSVEVEYDKQENQPKKIIGILMPKIFDKMRTASQPDGLKYLQVFAAALETKDVQIWLARPEEQKTVESLRWAGRMPNTPGDALAVIEANIGGQKTDAVIKESVIHQVEIQDDGSLIDQVTLKRTHNGSKGELFRGANNVAFVRFYVPKGSELLSASGFMPPADPLFKLSLPRDQADADLTAWTTNERSLAGLSVVEESGRTSFGGWTQLMPGHFSITTIRYRLPMTVQEMAQRFAPSDEPRTPSQAGAYLLSLTSQSGKASREVELRVRIPSAWRLKWSSVEWRTQGEWLTLPSEAWNRDRAFGFLFDRSHVAVE